MLKFVLKGPQLCTRTSLGAMLNLDLNLYEPETKNCEQQAEAELGQAQPKLKLWLGLNDLWYNWQLKKII